MSTTSPMTYATLINQIQLMTLNDPTPPSSSSQEYSIYSQMINYLAIPAWENERGVLWNELWVDEQNYATIGANQADIALPANFKFLYDGVVVLTYPGSTSASPNKRAFKVKKLEERQLNPRNTLPEFYVYGNNVNGFFLSLGWNPQSGDAEIGATISFRYYKYANLLSATTDIPEMSDPNFIIYKVSAQVSANNFNMNLYQIMEDKANYSLQQMRNANDMSANYQDDYVKDIDQLLGYSSRLPNRYNTGYWQNGIGS